MVQQCRRCGQVHDAYTGCTVAVRTTGRATVVGDDEALVGNIVAERYQVGEVLGKGATGTVFEVEHVSFARSAAMKVLRPHYASAEIVSRVFHGEARAAWSVRHPGLCEVFDIGSLPDGTPFFVMERLEGETLAARIARERLSLASAVDVVMQLLSAVAAIHARDLLLRDLRPQNVFLAHRRGCRPLLKILDFGLARLAPLERIQAEWDALRATTNVDGVGSTAIPYYLSPERTQGEHGVEPASDLFVVGTVLYEALTGARPFTASSWSGILAQIMTARPTPLHELRPDVSPDLGAFVARTLAANPRVRPSTAKEMQDELRSIFEGGRKASTSMRAISPETLRTAPAAPFSTMSSASDEPATFGSLVAPSFPAPVSAPMPTESGTRRAAHAAPEAPKPPPVTLGPDLHELPILGGDVYGEETQTKREALLDVLPQSVAHLLPRLHHDVLEDELSTAARRLDPAVLRHLSDHPSTERFATGSAEVGSLDEASADNADRTVPPPSMLGESIDVTFDEVDRTVDRPPLVVAARTLSEDEETETMELTPELKARVEQLMALKPAPLPGKLLPQPAPPAVKPPRRRGS